MPWQNKHRWLRIEVVAMLRFVRMMRLARLLRLLKLFKELWLMVSGLLQSLKTLGWICLVALLFCYACVTGAEILACTIYSIIV